MKGKKIIALIGAFVLCVGVFAGCSMENTQEVFSVNGEAVGRGEFTFFLENMKALIAQESNLDTTDESIWDTAEIDNKKAIDVAKDKAVEDVVSLLVQVQKAKEEGLTLTEDDQKEINKQKNTFVQQYGGENSFNEQLKSWQISEDTFDEILQDYKYASKLQEKYMAEDEKINNITDEEIQAKYDSEHEAALREQIFVKHILIMPKEATDTEAAVTDEQAQAQAQEILDRINAGEDFDTLMREYSDDLETSFDGYSFTHNDGQFIQEFDDAAYALAVNEVSGIVKTKDGYHIIKRLPLESDEFPALDTVRDTVIEIIKSERYQTMVAEEWVPAATVVTQEEVFNSIK